MDSDRSGDVVMLLLLSVISIVFLELLQLVFSFGRSGDLTIFWSLGIGGEHPIGSRVQEAGDIVKRQSSITRNYSYLFSSLVYGSRTTDEWSLIAV